MLDKEIAAFVPMSNTSKEIAAFVPMTSTKLYGAEKGDIAAEYLRVADLVKFPGLPGRPDGLTDEGESAESGHHCPSPSMGP